VEDHLTLKGLFKPRDKRFVAKAKDLESHCGYQEWHRKVDEEVIDWLNKYPEATPKQFLRFLRELYKRPDMLERFPNGF
jgi:elongation factor P hydroxylase